MSNIRIESITVLFGFQLVKRSRSNAWTDCRSSLGYSYLFIQEISLYCINYHYKRVWWSICSQVGVCYFIDVPNGIR